MNEPKYIVNELIGLYTTKRHEAYNMKDVYSIVSGLIQEAKSKASKNVSLNIDLNV